MPEPFDPKPAITLRSVLIGLLGVCFICGLAAYNDFAMENTFLIGNFLPIGLVLIVLVLVIGVNVPLFKLAPKYTLRQSELAVILLMVLVACAVPSSGLMRYLPSSLTGIYMGAAERRGDWGPAVDAAKVPEWLLPHVTGETAADKGGDPVFTYFRYRAPDGAVPWQAWIRPFLSWGILIGLLWGLLITLSLIVRKQWTENERLTFPLATIYESLIEPPAPGRALNGLFRSGGFWYAAASVFCIHSLNALYKYDPSWPNVPLTYDLQTMLVDPPWSFTTWGFKTATISFSMIGIGYLMQTKTSFSIWFMFILWQAAEMLFGTLEMPLTDNMKLDQTFGGIVAYAAMIVYIGRHHWAMVLRHMFGRFRANEHEGPYLPYRVLGWLATLFFAGVVTWLCVAGVSIVVAVALTLITVVLFMVVARVLADTGLFFSQISFMTNRMFHYPVLIPPTPIYSSPTSFFFVGWFTELFHDLRESLAGFFQQGIKVQDDTTMAGRQKRSAGAMLIVLVVLSLGVAYFVSWASMLSVEYQFAQTTSSGAVVPNIYGVEDAVRKNVLESSTAYQAKNVPSESAAPLASPLLQISVGAAIVGVCSTLRILLSWWPLHPVGFVVLYSYATSKIWFGILLGWVAKVVILRIGGASLLRSARATFIGLIVGEAFAAAVWLIINLVRHLNGLEYKSLLFLPG